MPGDVRVSGLTGPTSCSNARAPVAARYAGFASFAASRCGVHFGAEQHDGGRQKEIQQQYDHRAHAAVGLVVITETLHVKREPKGRQIHTDTASTAPGEISRKGCLRLGPA